MLSSALVGLNLAATMLCGVALLLEVIRPDKWTKSRVAWTVFIGVMVVANSVCFAIGLCDCIANLII